MRRRWSPTSQLYLAASGALALVVALMVNGYLTRVTGAAAEGGPKVPVVFAAQMIGRAEPVVAERLRIGLVPRAYAPPGAMSSIEQAVGRVALVDLAAGEAVTETRLARVRAGPVASLVPQGLRAFAVPTSLPHGAVAVGDLVDVLATYGSGQPRTETVVAGVEILLVLAGASARTSSAGGLELDAAGAGATEPTVLVLLVSPDQQERLAFARAFANLEVTIQPALRTSG